MFSVWGVRLTLRGGGVELDHPPSIVYVGVEVAGAVERTFVGGAPIVLK